MEGQIYQGETVSATGAQDFDLSFIDRDSGGDLNYLDALWIDYSITALTQGAGSGATVKEIHDTISNVQLQANGSWGPEALSGSDLAAIHYHARGNAFPWVDANGDATVAAGAGPVARRFVVPIFCPALFGRQGTEFTPLAEVINSGIVKANFANPDADTTTFTFAATMFAFCHREAKIKAVAPLHYTKQTLKSSNASLPIRGPALLVQHGLWKPGSNRTAAEVTEVVLKSGNQSILSLADPTNTFNPALWQNPEVTSIRLVRHFADPVGGTNINYLPLVPNGKQRETSISEMASGLSFDQNLLGSLTASQYQNLSVWAEALEDTEVERQWASVGAIGSAAAGSPHTMNGNANANDRLYPYLPRVFSNPAAVVKT